MFFSNLGIIMEKNEMINSAIASIDGATMLKKNLFRFFSGILVC